MVYMDIAIRLLDQSSYVSEEYLNDH
jgi:hypothetical protein